MRLKIFGDLMLDPEYRRKRDFLASIPIFHELRKSDFVHLIKSLEERTYLKGEILFKEGDIGRALFVVVSGTVNLTRSCGDGKSKFLAEIRPGEIFGEMALLEEMPRTGTATAAEKTAVCMLYRSKLDALLYDYPHIGVDIIHYLARTLSARLRSHMEAQNELPEGCKE